MHGALWLVAVATALVCVAADGPLKAQYTIQRSFDGVQWDPRAGVTVTRSDATATARLKSVPTTSKTDVDALVKASQLYYRIVDANSVTVASLVTSPCALVRGFDAVSSQSLKLFERIGVVVGDGVRVYGLQLSPLSNLHHQGVKASECDASVLSLFSDISVDLSVSLVKPVEAKIVSKFEDGPAAGAPAPPVKKAAAPGKEGEPSKDEPQEDNRSFVEKYWVYIAMFAVYSVVNGLMAPKQAAAGAAPAK